MKRLVIGIVCALVMATGLGSITARAQDAVLQIDMDKLPPGSTVTVSVNLGSAPTTANGTAPASGDLALALKIGSMPKGKSVSVDVYVGDCPNKQVRAWIQLQGLPQPRECNNVKIGFFELSKHHHIQIHYPGSLSAGGNGFFTPRNEILMGGAGAGVVLAVVLTGDNNSNDGGTNTPGGTMPTYTDYNGVYQGTGNKTGDGCNNGFSQTAPMTGTLTLNTSGTGTWVKTHTSVAVTFNFNVSATLNATGVAFNGTTTKAIGADNYSVADNGNIVKSNGKYTMTLTQVFTRLGASPCTITYSVTMVLG